MFLALHECGHVSKWRVQSTTPKVGELITCYYCRDSTRIKEVIGPWRARCHDCRRVNNHATQRATVMNTAITHAQEWSTHRVWVWQYGDISSRTLISATENVGTQPPLFTDAPF